MYWFFSLVLVEHLLQTLPERRGMVGLDTSEYASVSLLKPLPSEFRKHCFHYYLIPTAIVEVSCAVLMLCLEAVEALGSSPDPRPEVLQ